MDVSIYSIFPLLSSLFLLFLGVFVYFKKRGSTVNLSLGIYCLAGFIWLFSEAISYSISDKALAFLWLKISFTGVILLPISFAYFYFTFLNIKHHKKIIAFYYLLGFILIYFLWETDYIISDLYKYFWGYYPKAGLLHPYFVFFTIITVFISNLLLIINWLKKRKEKSIYKYRIIYTFLGSIIYSLAIVDFIPNYGIEIYSLGWLFAIIFVSITAYAIIKYQLMDIRLVIKKGLIYSVIIAVISGIIFSVSFLNSWFKENVPGFKPWMIPLFAGIAAFIVGNLFWRKSKEVDKLKYEFITVAAHKLRTPLTDIKWAAVSLKDEKIPSKDKDKLIEEIISADERLIDLTNELLAITKTKANQYQYNFEHTDLEKVIRKVVNSFQIQMKEKGIKLIYNAEKNLPKIRVDKERISSVVQTLLENAVLYTKDEIKINIDVYKNSVIFHIEDNGIGVNKEDQPYIFSKFYRTHEAYLTETEGAGIGLFLAQSIIDKHNGKIGVRSEGKGKGSIFWFSLPF